MQGTDHGLTGVGSHLGQGAFESFASGSKGAERVVDPDAPVGAGDDLARRGGALSQSGLVQAECELDEVGDAFAGHTSALSIFERLAFPACRKETMLEVTLANDAEMFRGDRLAVSLHRRQQLGDAGAINPI